MNDITFKTRYRFALCMFCHDWQLAENHKHDHNESACWATGPATATRHHVPAVIRSPKLLFVSPKSQVRVIPIKESVSVCIKLHSSVECYLRNHSGGSPTPRTREIDSLDANLSRPIVDTPAFLDDHRLLYAAVQIAVITCKWPKNFFVYTCMHDSIVASSIWIGDWP